MKGDKELPSEYVSIRQIWLQGINDCRTAIGQRAIQQATEEKEWRQIGDKTVIYTVEALYNSLVDYGEATVRSDVDHFYKEKHKPEINKIWDSDKSNENKLFRHGKASIKFYDFIIQTLNKYGMLFEQQPQGYSNVEMRSIE